MCGRYQLDLSDPMKFKQRFKTAHAPAMESRYNIAPSQQLPVITYDNTLETMTWGLIPFWEEKKQSPHALINIREDTILTKAWTKKYITEERCIIPASGFYEWKKTADGKVPYYFHMQGSEYFAFAGVYHNNRYAIITTSANDDMNSIHHRMPVILSEQAEHDWLNPDTVEIEHLAPYFNSSTFPHLEHYEISKAINSPAHDAKEVIERA